MWNRLLFDKLSDNQLTLSFRERFNRLRKSDGFVYFFRYFRVFTLIFIGMTVIILQIMRSSIYDFTDRSLKYMAKDPVRIVNLAQIRSAYSFEVYQPDGTKIDPRPTQEETERPPQEGVKDPDSFRLASSANVILFDERGNILYSGDPFSGLGEIEVDDEAVGTIKEVQTENLYGGIEHFRYVVVRVKGLGFQSLDDKIKYAVAVINTTQLRDTLAANERTILLIMIAFWLLSIITSYLLANMTVKPLRTAFEKQKAFVENASHELRTPLTVLQNRLETLFHQPDATVLELSEPIANSLDEVRNMRFLTSRLLELTRSEGGFNLNLTVLTPEFFYNLFDNYQIIADDHGKLLTAENYLTTPFKSDETLLRQLITILFDNALKYTDSDGEITIMVERKAKQLIIAVADNGPGISKEDKTRIFDRFYRVDKARARQKGGFGLGLSLAKQIVDTLRGTLTVKDNQPTGTIFEIRLGKL